MTSSSSTLLKAAPSIGPVSGLRPPSPRRYSVDRSASLTGTRFSAAASRRTAAASASGAVPLTGSLPPPGGGTRSGIETDSGCLAAAGRAARSERAAVRAAAKRTMELNLISHRVGILRAAHQLGQRQLFQHALLLGLDLAPDR